MIIRSLLLGSLLFLVTAKGQEDESRHLGYSQCRCEAPHENFYSRRLRSENPDHNRELGLFSTKKKSDGLFVVHGILVLPAFDDACSGHRRLEQEEEVELDEDEVGEMDEEALKEDLLEYELAMTQEDLSATTPVNFRDLKGKGGNSGKGGKGYYFGGKGKGNGRGMGKGRGNGKGRGKGKGKGVNTRIFPCPAPTPQPCDICSGSIIGNANGIVILGGAMLTCGDAQAAGGAGLIQRDECVDVQDDALNACECIGETEVDCSVCGGTIAGNPNGVITVNRVMLTCAQAEAAGHDGLIDPDECSVVQSQANSICACGIVDTCNICGPGGIIGNPSGIIIYGIRCAEAQSLSDMGEISDRDCTILQGENQACGCMFEDPGAPRVPPSAAPSVSPSASPSAMPISMQTIVDSATPTIATAPRDTPSAKPTGGPSGSPAAAVTAAPSATPTPVPSNAIGTPAPPTTCNVLSRQDAFLNILTPITSEDLLLDPATPQGAAFDFLVSGDPAAVDPCTYPTVEQRYASVVLYEATIGAEWTNSTGWLLASSECDWLGLRCNDEGMVVSVILPSNNLGGTLPEEISAFSELVAFDIFRNSVGGTIPASLPKLTNLSRFDVEENQLVGPAFVNVTGMDSLNVYRVSFNELTGGLPLTALAEVTNLKELWVAANNLAGTIPPTIALLTNLELFYIYDNNFDGPLPNELRALKLMELQAQGNSFTGTIPEGLYFNNALTKLRLDENMFTGTISGRAGDLVDLGDLQLNDNALTGTIPATLSRLSQLRFLLVHDNMLEGTIRDTFDAFELLQFADYSNNVLTGMVPASIFDLPGIKTLYFSNNDLTGFIPSNYGNAALLEDLFLDGNQISGLVPPIDPGQLPDLTRFKIEDNNLTGSVPASVCALRLSDSLEIFSADCGGIPPEIECDDDCCTSCFADDGDVRGLKYPGFRYVKYAALSATPLASATVLGYTADTWNTPGTLALEETAFSELPTFEKVAFTVMGFEKQQYDCFVNHYEDYSWAELATLEVQQYFVALGWNELFWNNATGVPDSEDMTWDELTADEQDAADNICYVQELWDSESLLLWGTDE